MILQICGISHPVRLVPALLKQNHNLWSSSRIFVVIHYFSWDFESSICLGLHNTVQSLVDSTSSHLQGGLSLRYFRGILLLLSNILGSAFIPRTWLRKSFGNWRWWTLGSWWLDCLRIGKWVLGISTGFRTGLGVWEESIYLGHPINYMTWNSYINQNKIRLCQIQKISLKMFSDSRWVEWLVLEQGKPLECHPEIRCVVASSTGVAQ